MARRRHYRGLVRFPGLGFLPKIPSSVKPSDVAVGMALGLAGGFALKKGIEMSGIAIPDIVPTPILAGAVSAAALYYGQKRSSRGAGHAVGAALGGVIVWAYGQAAARGMLGDLRTLPSGYGGYGAPLFDNPRRMAGAIFDNPNINLGHLARIQGMGDENEDGMFPAP